jgi:putative two-component system response regulator
MYIPDVSKLHPSDHIRQILEPQGVKSLITIPLFYQSQLYGFIGFDSVKQKRKYTQFEQYVLTEYSHLLISVIQRIELDQQLQKEKLRSDLLLEAAGIGAWEWDISTDIIKLNSTWATMLGYTLDELGEQTLDTWKRHTHPDDLPIALDSIKKFMNHEIDHYEAEFRMLHKDGHEVWIKDVGRFINQPTNHQTVMLGGHFEISELKNEQRKLKVITQAVEYSPSGVLITNSKGIIEYINPRICEMTGYKPHELIGQKPSIFKSGYHTNDYYKKMYETINSGRVWQGEFLNMRKDGSTYWESVSISAVVDSHDQITHLIAIKTDHSEKKAAQDALEAKRRELEEEVRDKMIEIEESQHAAILALAKLTEARDSDTGDHLERVQHLSRSLASKLRELPKYSKQINNQYLKDIYFASALHDIGKINIPDRILLKPGKLTDDEMNIMKSHVALGEKVLSDMVKYYPKNSLILMARTIAKYHHEKWNGKGYLLGVSGDDIPLPARIMAVVDVYDALRSKRPYKNEMTHQQAYNIIVADSGQHFDPEVVAAFVDIHEQFEAIYSSLSK